MAAVAMANGLNANLVRRWVVQAGVSPANSQSPVGAGMLQETGGAPQLGTFVPVKLEGGVCGPDIRIEINRHGTIVNVNWPTSAAGDCAAWLREVLR
jgi:transposase